MKKKKRIMYLIFHVLCVLHVFVYLLLGIAVISKLSVVQSLICFAVSFCFLSVVLHKRFAYYGLAVWQSLMVLLMAYLSIAFLFACNDGMYAEKSKLYTEFLLFIWLGMLIKDVFIWYFLIANKRLLCSQRLWLDATL